jgi:hypothetical protein
MGSQPSIRPPQSNYRCKHDFYDPRRSKRLQGVMASLFSQGVYYVEYLSPGLYAMLSRLYWPFRLLWQSDLII